MRQQWQGRESLIAALDLTTPGQAVVRLHAGEGRHSKHRARLLGALRPADFIEMDTNLTLGRFPKGPSPQARTPFPLPQADEGNAVPQPDARRGASDAMRNLLTGLDVGSSKVCAIVGESLPDGQLATLGFGIAPCTGLRKGVVVDIEATVDAIRAAIDEAEKTSGVRIGSGGGCVAGPHIKGLNSHGIVAVRGGEVGARDVDRVIDAAREEEEEASAGELLLKQPTGRMLR